MFFSSTAAIEVSVTLEEFELIWKQDGGHCYADGLQHKIVAALLTNGWFSVLKIDKHRLFPCISMLPDRKPNITNKVSQRYITKDMVSAVTKIQDKL